MTSFVSAAAGGHYPNGSGDGATIIVAINGNRTFTPPHVFVGLLEDDF